MYVVRHWSMRHARGLEIFYDAFEWLLVALITIFSLSGNTLMVRSYQSGPASLIAPFIYMQLIWAALLGWLIFGAFPDGWSLAGMITIVAAGLLLVPRQSLRRSR